MKKPYILIVEDEAILYDQLKKKLETKGYEVSAYIPSVDEALTSISLRTPDLALLDINLQGDANGLDLGKVLDRDYNIPVMYLTERRDDESYYEGLYGSNLKGFLVKVNNKIDYDFLIREIVRVLHNSKKGVEYIDTEYIIGFVDYVKKTKNLSKDDIQQKTASLKDVAYFTRNSTTIDEELSQGKDYKEFKKIPSNYVRFLDWKNQSLYIPRNLKRIVPKLPYYFVQISDHMVINIHPDELQGTINGSFVKLRDGYKYKISDTYKAEVEKRMQHFYLSAKSIKKR